MPVDLKERAEDLLSRAGLGPLPPATLVAAVAACAIVAVFALWRWWPGGDAAAFEVEEVASSGSRVAIEVAAPGTSAVASPSAGILVVHVVGSVRHPGVYRLRSGDRAIDAIEAAGGLLSDAAPERLNLARTLADGEQVAVPSEDEPTGPAAGPSAEGGGIVPPPSGATAAGNGAMININTADEQALDSLPGVGPSTAQKIVADRQANGPFASVEDLGRVSGIGPKKLEQLSGLVCVN